MPRVTLNEIDSDPLLHLATSMVTNQYIRINSDFGRSALSIWILDQYPIERDFFTGIKAGEFSTYDQLRRNLLYRLESRYSITQTVVLYAYPRKQLVAFIGNSWSPWKIQIYDLRFNQWIFGRIRQSFAGYGFRYTIQYANCCLILEHRAFSLTTGISDEHQQDYILARIKMRLTYAIWSNKYDLQVYTDELPDTIYLLAIAAYDYDNTVQKRPNQNGK